MIPTDAPEPSSITTLGGAARGGGAGRAFGIVLAGASVIVLIAFAQHPSIHTHELGEAVEAMSRIAMKNMLVHGVLIAMMGALTLGFWGLTDRLAMAGGDHVQFSRKLVISRGGLVAYAMGALAMMGAATVNGFFVSGLAMAYHDVEPAKLEPLRALLVFCHTANATLDVMGIIGMSLGVLLWSVLLVQRPGGTRIIGAFGLIVSAPLPVLLIAGHAAMTLHGMGAFLLAQVLWNIAVAVQMMRGRI